MEPLVAMLRDTFDETDRVVEGVTPASATDVALGSSYSWTYGHLANRLDEWVNVRFDHRPPHCLLGHEDFKRGGTGIAEDWPAVRRAVVEVREQALAFLKSVTPQQFRTPIGYDGPYAAIRERGITLEYAIHRIIAHHYYHIGEIGTKRSSSGESVGDYPGPLNQTLHSCHSPEH